MTIMEFIDKYNLYGSIITAWNWADSHRLVLEVDLSNLNQIGYKEDQADFRSIILIFENCTVIDELNEGFDGFSDGDARIIEAIEIDPAVHLGNKHGIKIAMMHDRYDGTEETLVSVVLFAEKISVADPDNKC